MKKRNLFAALSIALLLGACQSNSTTDTKRKDANAIKSENVASETKKETTQTNAQAKKTTYPLEITTYGSDGKELKTIYDKAPTKVLAVYQGNIETLLALGLEKNIVAAAGLDNALPESQKAAFKDVNYLEEFTPSLEKVTVLEPDMIFSWGSLFGEKTLGDAKGWVDKHQNVYINSNTRRAVDKQVANRTLENEYTDILNIGQIFDVQDKAEALVKDMKDAIVSVQNKTKDLTPKPTALIVEHSKDSFRNYGPTTLGGDMVTILGGELLNKDAKNLGKENLIEANPDVIFVVYMPYEGDNPEEVKQKNLDYILKDDALKELKAVKNNRVVPIMLSEMYASATRTKYGIVTFAKGLYPSVDLGLGK